MFSKDGDKIRAFPFRPAAESLGLTDYIEGSGCNGLLIEAVKKLYEVANKPENPIEWLRLYFKYLAEDVAAGVVGGGGGASESGAGGDADSDFTRDPEEVELCLKAELGEIEEEIISCFEEESQNDAVIEKMDNEFKKITLGSSKSMFNDEFLKYLEHREDYHYRIRPDPMYQASKSDMLLEREDVDKRQGLGLGVGGHGQGGGFGGGAPLQKEDSMVELVPFNATMWGGDGGRISNLGRGDEGLKVYEDYPLLYFPERQKEMEVEEEEMEGSEDGDEGEEEEEEGGGDEEVDLTFSGSEAGAKEGASSGGKKGGAGVGGSDYDGGSEGEGGESDMSRSKMKQYTPRSAHERKHKEKHSSQKGQQKKTSDKNV